VSTPCDKCERAMEAGQPVVVILDAEWTEEGDSEVPYRDESVRFLCHRACWDGVEVAECLTQPACPVCQRRPCRLCGGEERFICGICEAVASVVDQ
jgi:hypothetical protein